MKRPLHFLVLVSLVAGGAGDLVASPIQPVSEATTRRLLTQERPLSAEEILRRALDARGGESAAAQIQSFRCKGTADFAGVGRSAFESLATRSNQALAIFDFGAGAEFRFGFDGQTAWETKPGSAPETQSAEKLQESRDHAAFFASYGDARNFRSVACVGETSFDGVKCYELRVQTMSGLEQTHYYNASNYLLAGTLERVATESGPLLCRRSFLEYRKFAGFLFPTRVRSRTDEGEWLFRVNTVQVNCVPGSAFRMPSAPAAVKANSKAAERPATLTDSEIKTVLHDCIDGDKVGVGVVVGFVDAQGSRVFSFGKMDNGSSPEVNGDTLFEIGSITKVLTHLLLHDMVARGEMNIDDPVQKYVPASVRMPTRHGKQITLWDLSMHTSGLPRDIDDPHSIKHLYAFLAGHNLRRDPAEQFEYSNLGVALLGHVIALKTGQDYETLVRERICRPLKMDSTFITFTPEIQARRAVGHSPANHRADYIGLQDLPGAGAFFSTANDMLKLAAVKMGFTNLPLTPLVKKAVPGHNGGTYGFSSLLTFDAKQHRGMIVLSNCRDDVLVEHVALLLKNQSPKPPQTVRLNTDIYDRYVGQYLAGDCIRTVRRDGGRLLLQEWGKPGCELFPLSETNFWNQLFDCRATFIHDDNTGPARELIIGDWRGARLSGQILQPAASPLAESDCPPRNDSDLQGVWKGTIRPWFWPFFAVHFKVKITEPSRGAFRAEGDSPEQGVSSLPLGIIYNQPTVKVLTLIGGGSFQGTLNLAHTKVTGHWKQEGHSIRVTFRRVAPSPQAAP